MKNYRYSHKPKIDKDYKTYLKEMKDMLVDASDETKEFYEQYLMKCYQFLADLNDHISEESNKDD